RARVALAEAYCREGEDRRAVETAEGVLKDIPPHFAMEHVRAHQALAVAYRRLGDHERAGHHRRQRALYKAKANARAAAR
ncbi:MAG: hypothetical protein NT045_01940, partial [Candidatus Aureabacteria bacterium]|nr:hypothetical protein [Candidatus Auribacterota bacterium]